MKRIFILSLLLLTIIGIKAQQNAMYTHYSFNTLAINPAYAGSRDALTVTGLHRSMWVGFPGAPITQTLTAHAPVFNNKVGLGLSVVSDRIGPTKQTSFSADYAYKINFDKGRVFAFGLKGGLGFLTNDLASLNPNDANDPAYQKNYKSELLPIFGFGLYYSTPKYYLGVSIPTYYQ
jgi:type IX secretion system PorP/SprF family membrane protein